MLKLISFIVSCLLIFPWTEGVNITVKPSNERNGDITDIPYGDLLADMWNEGGDIVKIIWQDCSKKLISIKEQQDFMDSLPKTIRCMKKKSLRALDRTLNADILPVAEGVNLVRYELIDQHGQVVHGSVDDIYNGTISDQELDRNDWRQMALERIAHVLQTHVIKLDFDENGKSNIPEKAEFRHRRRNQMMTMMMFGIVSVGMIFVPMGFQFLAVLGGKALLLAKMALILSSIQGLKKVDEWNRIEHNTEKIATSPLNYGFYNTYSPPYEQFEKRAYNFVDDGPETNITPFSRHKPLAPSSEDLNYEQIKYNYDSEIKEYKPELSKAMKNSLYSILKPAAHPSYSDAFPTDKVESTDLRAEYIIDLPLNKISYEAPLSGNAL